MKFAGEFKLDGKNAEDLIRAFFEEFNPKSTLHINGDTANAEIFFEENPPMKIVNAISRCNILSFDYEESEKRYMDDEVGAKETEKSDGEVEVNNDTEADSEGETGNGNESDSEVESNNKSESGKHCIPPPPINFLKIKANNETQSNSGVETSNETESDSEVELNNESESGKHCITPPPIDFLKVKANNETQSNSREEKGNETNSNNGVEESNEPQLDSKVQPTGNVAAKPEYNTIPELTSIAKEVSNYEMFLNAVMNWLKLGVRESKRMREQRRSAFLSIGAAVSKGYDSWNQIESHATYNGKDRLVLGDIVSKKMQECGYQKIKILKFFRILVSYKEYEFKNATVTVTESVANDNGTDMTSNHLNTEETQTSVTKADTNESTNNDAEVTGKADTDTGTETVEKVDTDAEIVEKTDTDAETEVTMPCFSEIPWFVDFLKTIDKTKTIEEKVEQVLFKMNLNNSKNTDVKEEILNLAIEAMKTEHIEDMIKQKPWKLRMDFATFLNDFAGEYSTSKVTARDFLKDLQGALV